ncbi:MAG: cyclic-di-AMP receptor [Armatimonadota bacterium]|nr:cyclic-di-AMP receptor [bacterium]
MKLAIAIVHERDKQKVSDALLRAGHKFTVVASTGGFLRDGNTTFLIGAEEAAVDHVIQTIREACPSRDEYVNQPPPDGLSAGGAIVNPVKVTVGGAIVFVVDVEQFIRV